MLDRGAFENTELTSRHYQTSPLVHWVLEIRYKISIKTHSFFNMTVFERLTKLKGFGFSRSALDLICSYLKKRQRVVIINNKMSSVEAIITGFPQQVIDGSFFFFTFSKTTLSRVSTSSQNTSKWKSLLWTSQNSSGTCGFEKVLLKYLRIYIYLVKIIFDL